MPPQTQHPSGGHGRRNLALLLLVAVILSSTACFCCVPAAMLGPMFLSPEYQARIRSDLDSGVLQELMPGIKEELAVFPVLCLVTYVPFGLLLAWIIRSRRALRRATDPDLTARAKPCTVCGTPQNSERELVCMKCGKPFCAFPAGGWVSPLRRFDKVALVTFIVLGVVATAFSIVGGLLALAPLVIAYLIVRGFVPGSDTPPKYWKTCGGAVYGPIDAEVRNTYLGERCDNCGGALPSTESRASGTGSSSSDRSNYDDYRRDPYSDRGSGEDSSRDDSHKRSIWDGWWFKD